MTPGAWGWAAVAASVAAADGYAIARKKPTMSDEFANNFGWGLVLLAGTAVHLLAHRRFTAPKENK